MNTASGTMRSGGREDRAESPSSHQYAVQVALVTMKERCQKLQERLICLERENATLKGFAASTCPAGNEAPSVVEAQLRDKIAKLQSQKSHLTHQIFIVASENKQLFDRLSRLTEANRSLGGHLSRISNALSRHDLTTSMDQSMSASALQTDRATHPAQKSASRSLSPSDLSSVSLRPEPEGAGTTGEQGTKAESLEEMSSKLIQNILQAKADLQSQYEQMVELQSDHSTEGDGQDRNVSQLAVRDLGFSFQNPKAIAEDAVDEAEEEMRALADKLAAARDALLQQQVQIRALVATYSSRKVRCQECEERRQEQNDLDSLKLWGSGEHMSYTSDHVHPSSQVTELNNNPDVLSHSDVTAAGAQESRDEHPEGVSASFERKCPMCLEYFEPQFSFEEFQKHVMSHFPDTREEDEVTADYVLVQPNVGL